MNDKEKLQKWFDDIVSERTTDTEPLRIEEEASSFIDDFHKVMEK